MDRNSRTHEPEDTVEPDGPLTRLVEHQSDGAERDNPEPPLPRQPEMKREGRDDYASGSPEHDDDREI